MAKHRVRIESKGKVYGTRITDADTGAEIRGVRRVSIDMDANGSDGYVVATIDVDAEIDIVAFADIRRFRLNNRTGEYTEITD
ncbi:MAG: hypothetical protein KDE45_05360 [Caldilineaceae bacterium]|nr:hypothetical protein [Caldilineaceae bacterium]